MPLSPLAPSVDRAATERARRPALLAVEAILADLRARRARLARVAGEDGVPAVLADLDALIDWALALRAGFGAPAPGGAFPPGTTDGAGDHARFAEAAAVMA